MEAKIQQDTKGALNREVARIGLTDLGYVVELCKEPQKLTPGSVAYGNVGWVRETARLSGIHLGLCGYVPYGLRKWSLPSERILTREVYSLNNIFVKPPPECHKEFNGFVIKDNKPELMLHLASYTGEFVITTQLAQLTSEWRCFVLDNEVVAARHYKGEFRIAPDWKIVDNMARQLKENKAWSFDVAVTSEGKTIILEMHTVFSLGTYGVNPSIFATLLDAAWEQEWKKQNKL